MANIGVNNRIGSVEKFINLTIPTVDDELVRAYLRRLACVMISGNIEKCIFVIMSSYIERKSHDTIASYVKSSLDRATNYKCQRIVELFHRFDPAWGGQIEDFFSNNPDVKLDVDSIYNNRNQIVHGQSVDIGETKLNSFYESHCKVIENIEKIVR